MSMFYFGTRVEVIRFPDRGTDPYPSLTENRLRHACCPVQFQPFLHYIYNQINLWESFSISSCSLGILSLVKIDNVLIDSLFLYPLWSEITLLLIRVPTKASPLPTSENIGETFKLELPFCIFTAQGNYSNVVNIQYSFFENNHVLLGVCQYFSDFSSFFPFAKEKYMKKLKTWFWLAICMHSTHLLVKMHNTDSFSLQPWKKICNEQRSYKKTNNIE